MKIMLCIAGLTLSLSAVSPVLRAAVVAGNFWHNPTFEAGSNLDLPSGTPDFWNRGGSDGSVTQVSTENSVSFSHSLALLDNSAAFGEWYSDRSLAGFASEGDVISLHWHEIFSIAPGNEMRVTVRLLDAGGNGPDNHFVVTGNSGGWDGSLATSIFVERNEQLLVGPGVVTLRIQLASGGPPNGTGQYIIDDLSAFVIPEPSANGLLSLGGLAGVIGFRRRRRITS